MNEPPPGRLVGAAVSGSLGAPLVVGWYVLTGSGRWRSLAAVAPLGFAALLVVAAAWLYRRSLDGRVALRVPLVTVVGMGVFGALGTTLAVGLLPDPTTRRTILLALNFASAGGAVGVVVGLFTASRAATIRTLRAREAALRGSRDEYRDLFDGVGDAAIVHDTRGRILAANDAARARLASDDSTLTGLSIGDVEGGADGETERWTVGGRLVYETSHVAADGERVPVEVSVSVVSYDGRPAVLSVARDVSRRRASERELARTRDQLQALNRVLRHDIRNDMQLVLGLADLLEDHVDDEGRDYLRSIVTTGNHVVELTRNSRDLARTVAGESELSLEPTPLGEALTAELDRRREAFDHAAIRLDGNLPEVQVRANALLPSVFRNLLNNAVKHSDRDEPTVVVSADLLRGDHCVRIRVADDGPGIPDDRKEAVFGKGEKGLDSEGTGLGLHLVRSLVDYYGGSTWIEDNDPRGSVFVVELPAESEGGDASTAGDG